LEEPVYQSTLKSGEILREEYRIESVLGNPGGFGITYLATDINLDRKVAIKQYLPGDLATREGAKTDREREKSDKKSSKTGKDYIREEAQRLAQFNHSNIVRILHFFTHENTAYLVMEYQEGLSLTEYLQQHGTLNQEELLGMVLPLLDALKQIHDEKFLHRDIKPNNIYIRHDKSPVLLDFGSARQALAKRSRSITTIVSPGYAPLEQYDDVASEQGEWTDIYALGGVMYYAITGETPPAATRRVNKDPMIPAITAGAGRYSKSILTAIDWALEPNDDKRPRSIEKWREQLLMDVEPSHHRLNHQTTSFSKFSNPNGGGEFRQISLSERSATIILPGLVVILLMIATAVSLYQLNQATQELNNLRQTVEIAQVAQQNANRGTLEREQQIKKLEKEIDAEQQKSANLELLLSQERKQRSEVEESRRRMQDALDRLRHFEPQAVEEAFQGKLPKSQITYYNVVGVRPDDHLIIREFAGHVYKKIGEIFPTATCVRYLRKLETLKNNQTWAFIEHTDSKRCVRGWVNATFLKEITDSHCDEHLSTLVTAQPCPDEESDPNQQNH
jgi:serine/threonine protein kinase